MIFDRLLGFGERVRTLRTERGWSQEELAERAGLHRNYVGYIERAERNPALTTVYTLADTLGVPVADLFSE